MSALVRSVLGWACVLKTASALFAALGAPGSASAARAIAAIQGRTGK